MSVTDLGWVKYPLATLVVLAFLTVLGLPYLVHARRRLPDHCALLAPIVGMAWVIIGVSWYGLLGKRLHGWLLLVVALIVLGVVVVPAIRRRPALRPLVRSFAGYAAPWAIGIVVATIFMLPAITSPLLGSGYVTSFSAGNNDIGAYIAEATTLAESGYEDAGYWYKWNAGTDPNTLGAKTDHTGANALLATVSAALNNPVWKIATITLMLVLASVLAGAVALARSFIKDNKAATLVIGAFAATTYLIWYLAANFFLAQLLCISLILAQLVLVQAALRTGPDWRLIVSIGALTAACLLSSPEVGAVAICLMAALLVARAAGSLLAREPVRAILRRLWHAAAQVVPALLLALLLIAPFVSDQISRTQRVAGFGIVGWPLDLRNAPTTLLGIDSIGSPRTPFSTLVWLVIAAALVAAFVWAYRKRQRGALVAGVFAAAMAMVCVVGAVRWGIIGYQSWKLIATISVPIAICAFVLILRPLNASWRMGVLAVAVALVGANVAASARSWTPVRNDPKALRSLSVPHELSNLLRSERLQRQPALNFYLPSMWLTMAAPAVYQGKGALSSPSYLSGAKPGLHPFSCSLYDRSLYKPSKRRKVVLTTANYVLVASPSCK